MARGVTLVATLVAAVALPSAAGAHAALSESEPADAAVVAGPLDSVTLRFTEGIESAFSTFRLYRIDAEVDLDSENADLRLNGLAAVIISRYLQGQEDGEGRIEIEVVTGAEDKSIVVLQAAEPLPPGHYVAMWRVLSVDTHVVDGHLIFTVLAEQDE